MDTIKCLCRSGVGDGDSYDIQALIKSQWTLALLVSCFSGSSTHFAKNKQMLGPTAPLRLSLITSEKVPEKETKVCQRH